MGIEFPEFRDSDRRRESGPLATGLIVVVLAFPAIYFGAELLAPGDEGLCPRAESEQLEAEIAASPIWSAATRRFTRSGERYEGCDPEQGLVSVGQWFKAASSRTVIETSAKDLLMEYGWTYTRQLTPTDATPDSEIPGLCFEQVVRGRAASARISFSEDLGNPAGEFTIVASMPTGKGTGPGC